MSAAAPPDDPDRTVTLPRQPAPASATPESSVLPRGTRLEEFEITGLVGEGGFGIVYLARDHSLQRNVALKEYMPAALAMRTGHTTVSVKSERDADTFAAGLKSFINEARLLAQFDHPSLVKVYRFWEANGTAYMVMPFYEGITLKKALLTLGGPPTEAWLKDLLRPLLDALAHLHRSDCFHRDIAPDNILILKDGRPLLLDFGAARRVIGDRTRALTVILKPGYAPVEQYAEMSELKQGAWTDIYALASVVYFAITGKAPLPSVARMMADPLEPLSKLAAGRYSERFLNGVDKALAVRPSERPQDIAELCALWGIDLAQPTDAGRPIAPVTPGTREAPARSATTAPRRSRHGVASLAAVAGVVLIAAIAGGSWFWTREREKKPVPPRVEEPARRPAAPPARVEKVTPAPPAPAPRIEEKPVSARQLMAEAFEGRDRSRSVTASVGRDHLGFSLRSSKPGYVYVLVARGNRPDVDLLFPNAVDQNNRLQPGQVLKLPRASWAINAQGPAGANDFLAIVSDEPRDFSAFASTSDDMFKRLQVDGGRLHRDQAAVSPVFAGSVVCASTTRCSESYGAVAFSIDVVSGQRESREAATGAKPPAARPRYQASPRCSDILERASLGEPLTPEEQTILRRDCR